MAIVMGAEVIKFRKLSDQATTPTRAHPLDSGFDLYTAQQDLVIMPGKTVVVGTGIAIELPRGFEAQVRPRSGISAKSGLIIMLGTIDNQYRGEIGIIVKNMGSEIEVLPNRMKLAQLVPMRISLFIMEEVSQLSDSSDRGTAGFGSSGMGV
jgi:dUTP pyrophosphatase